MRRIKVWPVALTAAAGVIGGLLAGSVLVGLAVVVGALLADALR